MRSYMNSWAGFTLELPEGFEVAVVKGVIGVKKDAAGITSAVVRPVRDPLAGSSETLARWFAGSLQSGYPGAKLWSAPGKVGGGVLVRAQLTYCGKRVSATYNVRGGDGHGLISGFQAPDETFKALAPELGAILSSLKPCPAVPRTVLHDPTEGAFAVQVPVGFQARAGISRATGMPQIGLEAQVTIREGIIRASIPPVTYRFSEAIGGRFINKIFGGLNAAIGGAPSEPWMSGVVFAKEWLAPHSAHPGCRVESVAERPDLLGVMAAETMRGGLDPSMCQFTAATARFRWSEGGHEHRERVEIATTRLPMMGMWSAFVNSTISAPVEAWDLHEPVLAGILDSFEMNPSWQQAQDQANAAANNARMQDIYARQRQISQTLSETSDIISQGYWGRQAVYDQISHDRSNAMRGVQDVRDFSGQVFNVPAGHDQYWRDNLNNVFGGSWLAQPDPTWQRLEPLK